MEQGQWIKIDKSKLISKIIADYRANIKGRIGGNNLGDDAIGLVCRAVDMTISVMTKTIKEAQNK